MREHNSNEIETSKTQLPFHILANAVQNISPKRIYINIILDKIAVKRDIPYEKYQK